MQPHRRPGGRLHGSAIRHTLSRLYLAQHGVEWPLRSKSGRNHRLLGLAEARTNRRNLHDGPNLLALRLRNLQQLG
jgi:hypothetical protein